MTLLTRATETATLEPYSSRDEQGAPTYGSSSEVEGRLVVSDEYEVTDGGAVVTSDARWYQDASETPLPSHRDRLTVDGTAYTVRSVARPKSGHGSVHHVTCELLEE